MKKNAVIVFL